VSTAAEVTAIVLRVSSDKAAEFESLFRQEEIPIWDDFTRRGRFERAVLVRAAGGNQRAAGTQDYIIFVVAAGEAAHGEHDDDPRFTAFLEKARRLQPQPPLVWFGEPVFERSAPHGQRVPGARSVSV
jgi:hypothetical protein